MGEGSSERSPAASAYREGNPFLLGNRVLFRKAFEMLEPCEGRLSRTVLRGLGASNGPWLPDRARNRRPHALSVSFLAEALPRSRAAGYADAVGLPNRADRTYRET